MSLIGKKKATDLITEVFSSIRRVEERGAEARMSSRLAGRLMVEMYRLLTGEMPQSPGIEIEYRADELPAVELSSPVERDPSVARWVHTGAFDGDPDIVWEEGDHDRRGILDGAQTYQGPERLQPPRKGRT